jgi:hypothetical protein
MDVDGNGLISREELLSTNKSVKEAEELVCSAQAQGGTSGEPKETVLPKVTKSFRCTRSVKLSCCVGFEYICWVSSICQRG